MTTLSATVLTNDVLCRPVEGRLYLLCFYVSTNYERVHSQNSELYVDWLHQVLTED